VGYQTKFIPINRRTDIDVSLQPATNKLKELVVLGYSKQAREQLTSAVTEVSGKELSGVTTANVATMLQGRVSGLVVTSNSGRPSETPQVRIRGTGSITAGSSPLYIIDGIIADGSIAQAIPTGNIASVSVLKDAAATALYGSRAANGVIVINTKSGQAGQTRINVNTSLGFARSEE